MLLVHGLTKRVGGPCVFLSFLLCRETNTFLQHVTCKVPATVIKNWIFLTEYISEIKLVYPHVIVSGLID